MATLSSLVAETTTIKNTLTTCHSKLKTNLTNKGVTVSSSDKLSTLVDKVANISQSNNGFSMQIKIHVQSTQPTSVKKGDIWINSTSKLNPIFTTSKPTSAKANDLWINLGNIVCELEIDSTLDNFISGRQKSFSLNLYSNTADYTSDKASMVTFLSNSYSSVLATFTAARVYNGSTWNKVVAKYWNGSAWSTVNTDHVDDFFVCHPKTLATTNAFSRMTLDGVIISTQYVSGTSSSTPSGTSFCHHGRSMCMTREGDIYAFATNGTNLTCVKLLKSNNYATSSSQIKTLKVGFGSTSGGVFQVKNYIDGTFIAHVAGYLKRFSYDGTTFTLINEVSVTPYCGIFSELYISKNGYVIVKEQTRVYIYDMNFNLIKTITLSAGADYDASTFTIDEEGNIYNLHYTSPNTFIYKHTASNNFALTNIKLTHDSSGGTSYYSLAYLTHPSTSEKMFYIQRFPSSGNSASVKGTYHAMNGELIATLTPSQSIYTPATAPKRPPAVHSSGRVAMSYCASSLYYNKIIIADFLGGNIITGAGTSSASSAYSAMPVSLSSDNVIQTFTELYGI